MSRRDRKDHPGALHHVYNRGIARRTMFETRADRRNFLALIARSVRRGEIRLHGFCLLSTHYHLLLESVEGKLDLAMQRIQTGYSRYFNRSRKRDGALVRGRFSSKRIDDVAYLNVVRAYIDRNAVEAGLCEAPGEYEFCGAHAMWEGRRWFARRRPGPGGKVRAEDLEIVGRRLFAPDRDDPAAELEAFTPEAVLRWMHRKAMIADGTEVGLPVCHAVDIREAMRGAGIGKTPVESDREFSSRIRSLSAGLLRLLCGEGVQVIGHRLGRSASTASGLIGTHRKRVMEDEAYARMAAEVAGKALELGPFSCRRRDD